MNEQARERIIKALNQAAFVVERLEELRAAAWLALRVTPVSLHVLRNLKIATDEASVAISQLIDAVSEGGSL